MGEGRKGEVRRESENRDGGAEWGKGGKGGKEGKEGKRDSGGENREGKEMGER